MTLLIALSKEVHEAVGLYEAAIGLGMAGGVIGWNTRWTFLALSVFRDEYFNFLSIYFSILFVKEPERKVKRKAAGVGNYLTW